MKILNNYLPVAKEHEAIFRNVLRDIKNRWDWGYKRSVGLNTNAPLEKIFNKHSTGNRHGKWTLLGFVMGPQCISGYKVLDRRGRVTQVLSPDWFLEPGQLLISHEDIATLSGQGQTDLYEINEDGTVRFVRHIEIWRS